MNLNKFTRLGPAICSFGMVGVLVACGFSDLGSWKFWVLLLMGVIQLVVGYLAGYFDGVAKKK